MSAEVGLSFGGGLGLASLVDSDDPELVPLALAQAGHPRFQLIDGGCTVLVVCDEGVEPAAKFVFLLDDVVGDGATSILLGLVPPKSDRLVVEVHNLRLARSTWWS